MGRPKKEESSEENVKPKKSSAGTYLSADYILDKETNIIKICPSVDMVLGGGWPDGTVGLLESPPKTGKTTLALKIGAKGQQQFDKTIIYDNIENRLSVKNLKGIEGLDLSPEKFKIISSTEGDILSTEQHFERAEKALNDFPNSILIIDSFSSLSSAAERTKAYGDGYGGMDSRKYEGEFLRRVSPILPINNSTIIGIAHVSQNIGTPGTSPKVSRAMLYQLDIRLSLKKVYPQGDWISGEKLIGQKVDVKCLTSALGSPGNSCVLWLKYGQGYLDSADFAQVGCDLGLIEKKGAGWFNITKFDAKAQGMESLCELIDTNKEIYNYLTKEISSLLI